MEENPSSPPAPASPAAPSAAGGNLERQCLEALKTIGKALGQMALYKVGHPAVAATIRTARENLDAALALAPNGELIVSLDQQKLLANGKVIGMANQLPNSIINLYNRFKLTSMSFRAGLTHEELAGFCELAALRADAAASTDPKAFLAGKGVTHLSLNEAVYMKAGQRSAPAEGGAVGGAGAGVGAGAGGGEGAVPEAGEGGGAGAGAGAGAGGAQSAEEQIADISAAIASGSLERTLTTLVEKAVPDPVLRAKVIAQVLKMLEADIAKHVEEVTLPLRREKKQVENEAARTSGVIQNMVEGVVVVDDQGKILMMNPAAESIYGETLAKSAGKAITEKSSDQFVVTMASNLQNSGDADVKPDVKTSGADEVKKTLKASSAVVQTEAGKVVGVVTALPDATKHRELQRMQRDFVAHVTHELRAPLSSIRAALEIIQSEFGAKMETEETRMLSTALKNSDRLAEMINGILDFSKIESGQMSVFPKPVEPEKIAQEAVDGLQPWAQKKRIELALTAPGGLPLVDADSPRTVQVIVNLLSNAIKFTPAGGKITVKLARRTEGAATFVEFAVSDTGPGIPQEEQTRVFEKFAQISGGETHVGGTGLGLSIAKALVVLQKGRMWIESQPGSGATFLFTLPVFAAQAVEATSVRTKAVAAQAPWWKKLLGLK
ncbi:MAG TPA: ATP-binding protein [Elusimicrobiota bacterium]|nr:ATP-binding protein [Elusimicrobiota bacterium]